MNRLSYRTVFDVDAKPGETSVEAWKRGAPAGANVTILIDPNELGRFARTYWMIPPPPADVAAHNRPYIAR